MEKGGFLQNSNFYLYLIQFWSNFHETTWLYCLSKVLPCSLVVLSMQNHVTGKGCLMSFTEGFLIFYFQIKHFSVSLRLFKIYVADQKPQTILSSFLSILNCVIEIEGLVKNSNTDFINVESLWMRHFLKRSPW